MNFDKYKLPLPEDMLIQRFSEPFKKLTKGYSATVVTLPHTGRTSHLRAVASNPYLLKKLGIKEELFVYIDMDLAVSSYETFLAEMIRTLVHTINEVQPNSAGSEIATGDTYLLSNELIKLTKELTNTNQIIFALTIKKKTLRYFKDLDSILVHLQKNAGKYPISILWNIDSYVLSNHEAGHPSSTLLHNLFYQKTFDQEETIHSVTRSAISKGKKLPATCAKNIMELTGGMAAFSHQLTNHISEDLSVDELLDKILSSKYSRDVIKNLQLEFEYDKNLSSKLTTPDAIKFLQKHKPSERQFLNITLKSDPTTQDILLIKLFKENLDEPVSRDDIAKAIWGKAWERKYSDWAIDKAIERLRKKIASPQYRLITIKNLGYQLIKL